MKRAYLVPLTVLAFALAAAAQPQEAKYIADTVTVQADATYEADPDLATLKFQVSATEKQLRKAYELATASLQRILQLAERTGLAKQDVTTGAFSVTPDIDWRDRKRKPKAYRVESSVTFRLRDFTRLGEIVDEAVDSGIAEFRSLDFSLENEEDAKVRAVSLARERAEARARAALGNGARLGNLRFVGVDVQHVERFVSTYWLRRQESFGFAASESANGVPAAPPPPVPAGSPEKVRVRATVNCVFQIAPEAKTGADE
ncbi:MAG TPA: SIMPL domain-containing protein [Candidatus Acidoferrales bacterium]